MAKKAKIKIYGAYRFTTKDPSIGEYHPLMEDHFGRKANAKDMVAISESGGPAASTIGSWIFGKTLRPQNATLEAAGRALGYRRQWVKMKMK